MPSSALTVFAEVLVLLKLTCSRSASASAATIRVPPSVLPPASPAAEGSAPALTEIDHVVLEVARE
ncbi:MAG: hypothetical protein KY463_04775 [Actinobacteria bacterium]|nr:hypothetical protein [Actinomycetota bacterium]